MGTCLSKKKGSSTAPHAGDGVTKSKTKVDEPEPQVKLKKENSKKRVEEKHESVAQKDEKGKVKREIFVIKHRKSHDHECTQQEGSSATATLFEAKGVLGVRPSSCTKEEVDAILIQCGRLSRNNSSGKKPMHSGSKRSYDFDNCGNDTVSNDEDQEKTNDSSGLCEDGGMIAEEKNHQHLQRHRESPKLSKGSSSRRRRTPSREREQCSSSRERRVSISPGKRSSDTNTIANASNNNCNASSSSSSSSRPGKMVSVPATISSMNNGGVGGGGEFASTTSIKRIIVRRNVGAASPRSQSPARPNGNAANGNKVLSENQQQHPSLSRNSSRKAEQSPHRRNPLSEIDPNTLACSHSTANNNSSRVQNKPKKEIETRANQKLNVDMNGNIKNWTSSRAELGKGVGANCKAIEQQEEDVKVQSLVTDNIVHMTAVPPEADSLKPQTLTRSRSSRQSIDLDHNPEDLLIPTPQSYTSLLLQDIQNFHQKNNTPSVSLPACVTKACSILEAVADLNSTTTSSKNPLTYQSSRNNYNVLLGSNQYGKRVLDIKDPFVESEVVVSDDVIKPSLHKYVIFERGGSLGGMDIMEDQESSRSNSFTVSSGEQQHWMSISSSREPNSVDSKDSRTSRMNYSREGGSEKPSRLRSEGVSVMMKP